MSGPNNEIYISFTSLVNPHTTQILMGALTNAVNNGHTKIHLMLSSPGGQVAEGITLYNLIRSLPIPVYTYNIGTVNSIANVVFQAGERRITATNSSFMFHGVGFDIQNARMELTHLIEKIQELQKDEALISAIMVERTGLSDAQAQNLFRTMAFMDAKKAVESGIADEVSDINLPSGVPVQQLIFQ